MNAKALQKQLIAAVAMLLVAAIALGSSTYAWFINNTTVTAGTATVTATASNTLLISEAGETPAWKTSLNWTDANTAFAPVSTIASKTATTMDFYSSADWDSDTSGAYTAKTFTKETDTTKYWTHSFKIKASQACSLYMDDATTFTATNGNMKNTLRVALVVTDSKDSYVGTYIYQVDNTASTTSVNTTLENQSAEGIKKAISAANAASDILGSNVKTDGVPVIALASTPVSTALATTLNGADPLYTFAEADAVCNITAYVWMEGCDYDCNAAEVVNFTGDANKLVASFGFCAGAAAA